MTQNEEDIVAVKKNRLAIMAVLLALSLLMPAMAQAEKIGFIDVREVLAKSESGKKAHAEFKKIFEKKRTVIQQKEADLKKQKEAFDQQKAGLSEITAKEKELELQKAIRDFQRMVNDANEEMKLKDQELSRKFIPEILKVVNTLAERDGYTLILDINNPVVVYSTRANNITDMVIIEFNKIPLKTAESGKPAKKGKKK
jgi:outer membrane protein